MASTAEKLRGLVLSATELREINPSWTGAMVEDYLNILENFITLSEEVDSEIDTSESLAQQVATLNLATGKNRSGISSLRQTVADVEQLVYQIGLIPIKRPVSKEWLTLNSGVWATGDSVSIVTSGFTFESFSEYRFTSTLGVNIFTGVFTKEMCITGNILNYYDSTGIEITSTTGFDVDNVNGNVTKIEGR